MTTTPLSQFKVTFIQKFNSIQDLSLRKRAGTDRESMYAIQIDEVVRLGELLDFTIENLPIAARLRTVSYEFIFQFQKVFEKWMIPVSNCIPKRADRPLFHTIVEKLNTTILTCKVLLDEQDILLAAGQLLTLRDPPYTYNYNYGPRPENIFQVR